MFLRRITVAAVCSVASCLAACTSAPSAAPARFVAAWAVSQGRIAEHAPALGNSTVRVVVRPTIGGTAVRIKLENTIATTPVTFAAAYIGVLDHGAQLVAGSNRQLTFAGQSTLTLQPGAGAYSDAVALPVQAFQRVAISLDVTSAGEISTHALGLASSHYAPGHIAKSESGAGFAPLPSQAQDVTSFPIYWVTALDVESTTGGAIVALGDSITDGRCSTTDSSGKVMPDLYQRWTDVLADRLASSPASSPKAVVNAGIAGNRVLEDGPTGPSALTRLDRDVLDRAGATHVILFEGTNDLSRGSTSAELIAGTKQIIDRVHARGMKIIGATVVPRGAPEGAPREGFSSLQERHRREVNDWMRNEAPFDGVIDFDAAMAGGGTSPTGAEIMKREYSCDFIHPNAAGYRALGEAIDLRLFE
ncbi:MAG: GDSL-type esterase/lipase family protein [Steroidobacter sp.]